MEEKKRKQAEQPPSKTKKSYLYRLTVLAFLCCAAVLLPVGQRLYREKQEAVKRVEERAALGNDRTGNDGMGNGGVENQNQLNRPIELDGKQYRRNTAIRAILCIGVDTKGEMEPQTASGVSGQADGIFLVAQDMARDTVKILMIPRDTMTEITLFDLMGNELGKDVQHLTLAFSYGDGREKSCELLRDAVSNLFFGLKIDGYLAMNISSIALLNDEIGGVTVTIEEDGLETRDPLLTKGSTVCLQGGQAEIFVRYRDIAKSQTALSRMDRQKQYMESYLQTVKEKAKKDNTLITRLVNDVQEHMITDMAKDQYMDMGLAVLNSQQQVGEHDFLTLPGQAVETKYFDEYHVDSEEMKRMIVELFYKEV